MEVVRKVSRQWSVGGRQAKPTLSGKWKLSFGRQSSLDPNKQKQSLDVDLCVPEQLDATMQMLFLTCRGDAEGVEALLDHHNAHPPLDVNIADFDGRTALHIAACQGHAHLVHLLISRGANVNARDRWGSTPLADAKYYGNIEICNILKRHGAKLPKTPMSVANPKHVPEYEVNPVELSFPRDADTSKDRYQLAKWNGTKVAVKILDKHYCSDTESMESFRNELTLLQKIRHPNVVQFIGAVTQNVPMMIVAEYLPNGDLSSYLKKKGRLQPAKAVRFALDVARGMNYLHECKPEAIIHCVLKPRNILCDSGGQLKVTDFGLSKLLKVSSDKVKESYTRHLHDRSRLYMAPEVYRNEEFDRSVDVFSFGLILYEMIEGTAPFHPNLPEEVSRMMALEDKRPPFKVKSKNYPGELKELIQECWDKNPLVRPTFSEIIVRLEKIKPLCVKHKFWSGAFKFPRSGAFSQIT